MRVLSTAFLATLLFGVVSYAFVAIADVSSADVSNAAVQGRESSPDKVVAAPESVESEMALNAATTTAQSTDTVDVPEPSSLAMQYYQSGNILWIVRQIMELAVPGLILFTGWSARLRKSAWSLGRKWFFVVGLYFLLYSLVDYALEFPLAWYAGYFRQHAYGLSNQTFAKWLANSLKMLGVDVVFGAVFLWIPYGLIHRSPRRWWLYTSLCAVPVIVFCMVIQPIWIDPLFNRFGPMKDKQLEARILSLADRAGIEGGRVFEVDKSVDTKAVNAYVTGFGSSKRIVLWDTLLAKLDADEVAFVMAHEMGHYVLHHILFGIGAACLGILIALYAVHRLVGVLLRRYHRQFGFDTLSDVASLPLVLGLVQIVGLVAIPVALALSRYQERAADRFALDLTRNNRAAATAFVKLSSENLANPRPGPLFTMFRASHPSIGSRIDFANTYRPWEQDEPQR